MVRLFTLALASALWVAGALLVLAGAGTFFWAFVYGPDRRSMLYGAALVVMGGLLASYATRRQERGRRAARESHNDRV